MFDFIKQPWRNSDLPVSILIHSVAGDHQSLSFFNIIPNSISFSKYAIEFKYSTLDNSTLHKHVYSFRMSPQIIKYFQLEEIFDDQTNEKALSFTLHFHVNFNESINDLHSGS